MRWTLDGDAQTPLANFPERIWFQLTDLERHRAVNHQRQLLSRVAYDAAMDEEVRAIAHTLASMTYGDANFESWFVVANDQDVAEWTRLLQPTLDRVLPQRPGDTGTSSG